MTAVILMLSLITPLAGAERLRVDTDCGFLRDDETTLARLLRSPEQVRVEEITLVSGNVWAAQSAFYIREILGLLGQSRLPVYLGAEMPLLHTPAMPEEAHRQWGPIQFRGAFAERPGSAPAKQSRGAVEYLIPSIEASPGQLTVVALGPISLWDSPVSARLINPVLFARPERLFLDVDTRFSPADGKVIPLNRKPAPEAAPGDMMNDLDYPRVYALFGELLTRRQ